MTIKRKEFLKAVIIELVKEIGKICLSLFVDHERSRSKRSRNLTSIPNNVEVLLRSMSHSSK